MKARLAVLVSVAVALSLTLAGKYHVLYGDAAHGMDVIPKISWSLSETFVNIDALGNMPMLFARAQYPLTVAALARRANERGLEKDLSVARKLAQGMDMEQVARIMGAPASRDGIGSTFENWTYRSPLAGQYVTVTFEKGRVIKVTD